MKLIFELDNQNLSDLNQTAAEVLKHMQPPAVLFIQGEMGSGKTTLVAEFCRQLKIAFPVQSPTYAVHNRYENKETSVDHFDLYRLDSEEQLEGSGFHDLLAMPGDYKFIEWAEKLDLSQYSYLSEVYLLEIKKATLAEARLYRMTHLF